MYSITMTKEEPKKLKQTLTRKYVVTEPLSFDASELIPISVRGRILPVPITVNELGKQLLKAAGEGNKDEVKALMSKGAPFTADWLGTSPLHIAAQNNNLEVCEILLRAGISRDARTKVDRTPLHMAAYEGHLEIVETLLSHGADYDCKDLLAMTPLHWAAQKGHAEIAATLIKYGASTALKNKFDLSPADIALQINRSDILEIIKNPVRDPAVATYHLALHLAADCGNSSSMDIEDSKDSENSLMPVDTVLLEDDSDNSIVEEIQTPDKETSSLEESVENNANSLAESLKLLQQHGIAMLQNDDSSIMSSVIESGRSVVLTDVGKEVLNSMKVLEPTPPVSPPKTISKPVERKKYITVTAEEFLAMTSNSSVNQANIVRQLNGKIVSVKPTVKRIVMKKNKTGPVSVTSHINKKVLHQPTDMETVMKQLIEARKVIEEYKQKLSKKEAEVEHYKQQLKVVLRTK